MTIAFVKKYLGNSLNCMATGNAGQSITPMLTLVSSYYPLLPGFHEVGNSAPPCSYCYDVQPHHSLKVIEISETVSQNKYFLPQVVFFRYFVTEFTLFSILLVAIKLLQCICKTI
jgi:hypothetical protein